MKWLKKILGFSEGGFYEPSAEAAMPSPKKEWRIIPVPHGKYALEITEMIIVPRSHLLFQWHWKRVAEYDSQDEALADVDHLNKRGVKGVLP